MTAKEYFDKYEERIVDDLRDGSVHEVYELYKEMVGEAMELGERRGIKRNSALVALLREMNQRWNCIAGMFEKKYDSGKEHWVFPRDMLKTLILQDQPQVKEAWK